MRFGLSLMLSASLMTAPTFADEFKNAPPSFMIDAKKIVPINMSEVHIDYTFDVSSKMAIAEATIKFQTNEDGQPFFDLIPEPISSSLDGWPLSKSDLSSIPMPSNVTTVRKINRDVMADTEHELKISYKLKSSDITWGTDSLRVGFFMSDLSDRKYFEQYGPANYEFDQVKYTFSVKVEGTSEEHEIFTNGSLTTTDANQFAIEFPQYFTASSIYFHMTKKDHFKKTSFIFQGLEKSFPVTIYAASSSSLVAASEETKTVLAELETTYGAYAHDRLVIYVTSNGGGMEYCGATMTSMWALSHELTHSWFARGVMPSNANSGWIDEAVASWRDESYPRASAAPNRSSVNLGGFSVYRRHTTQAAYSSGMTLISEFDYLNRNNGGMKTILRNMFNQKQRQTISLEWFKQFMESSLKMDLTAIFNRYVFGQSGVDEKGFKIVAPEQINAVKNRHPRPYTEAELIELR